MFLWLFLLLFNYSLGVFANENSPAAASAAKEKDGDLPPEQEVEVIVGIDKLISVDFAPYQIVSIGNKTILDYQIVPQKREIILKGLHQGQTSVTIRDTLGNVRLNYRAKVSTSGQSQTVSELREFLDDVEGLEIGVKGGKVYVGGEIVVPDDIGKVFVILDRYPDVIRLYEISPQTKLVVAQSMQKEMQKNNLPNVIARVVNNTFWLEGVVTSDAQRELALRIAEAYIPQYNLQPLAGQAARVESASKKSLIQNFITINPAKDPPPPQPKQIKIVAQFVELSRDYNKRYGMKWTPALSAGGGSISFGQTTTNGVTSKADGTFSGTISNLIPQLSSLKSAGYARVVESGMVITKERVKANIKKNSNTPFTLGSNEFQRVLNTTTGFTLDVQPQVLADDMVEMGVGFSVKLTRGTNGSTDNSVQTNVIVKSKESAVIGGITLNESQTDYDKDPANGADQVDPATGFPFFSFIRSKAYTLNKSQFVVFITPEIIESASSTTNDIKQKFRQRKR